MYTFARVTRARWVEMERLACLTEGSDVQESPNGCQYPILVDAVLRQSCAVRPGCISQCRRVETVRPEARGDLRKAGVPYALFGRDLSSGGA